MPTEPQPYCDGGGKWVGAGADSVCPQCGERVETTKYGYRHTHRRQRGGGE